MRHLRDATIDDLKHHPIPIVKKERDSISLHVRTNDAASNIWRQILDGLLQLKNFILNIISSRKLIIFKPAMRLGNGNVAITIRTLNSYLSQLVDCIDN